MSKTVGQAEKIAMRLPLDEFGLLFTTAQGEHCTDPGSSLHVDHVNDTCWSSAVW